MVRLHSARLGKGIRLGSAVLLASSLYGQVPDGWAARLPLGTGMQPGVWFGGGVWSADRHGPAAPFIESLGLGNGTVGNGVNAEMGWKGIHWDVAMRLTGYRDASGGDHALVSRGHLTYRSAGGWTTSLEREPLVWGYGLNGGYLLGEASRPIPKLRVATPMAPLSAWGVPLGAWKAQVFLGQVDAATTLPENIQSPSLKTRSIASQGTPVRPFLSGVRAEAAFGDSVEFYLNWISLFGGTLNGRQIDSGYTFTDYLTAFLGAKDARIEGGTDLVTGGPSQYRPLDVISASNSDVGMRIRFQVLESLLRARDVRFYVSRGSKGVHISYGPLLKKPLYYLGKDMDADWRAVTSFAPGSIWGRTYRYSAPSPIVPNDGVGVMIDWGVWKAGLEYLDTVNVRDFSGGTVPGVDPLYGHRSFTHSFYQVGFYDQGDPLGSALGGEARYGTFHVQWDPSRAWRFLGWIQSGDRPFRDDLGDWLLDHPGKHPVRNRFTQVQVVVEHHGRDGFLARSGASAQRQSAVLNEYGRGGTGFRWFLELGWTWGLGG